MSRNEVKFYHPELNTDNLDILIEYIKFKKYSKECIQISLDNCTIQRMELLTEGSTLDDVIEVGLYPLYRIINECPNILVAFLGAIEMPGSKVQRASEHYELFCRKFWKSSIDDPNAEYRNFDPLENKIYFNMFSDQKKQVLGNFYLPFLLMQLIYKELKGQSPIIKFEHYIYGVIYYLDMVSAFELELAKYAFWELSEKEIMLLPDSIRERRKLIRKNFTKEQNSLEKCQQFCINAAMDSFWLRAIAFGSDHKEELRNGWIISEHLLATNDDKLHFIAKDISPIRSNGQFGYQFLVSREKELDNWNYWKEVDNISHEILENRINQEHKFEEKMNRITDSIKEIENKLKDFL